MSQGIATALAELEQLVEGGECELFSNDWVEAVAELTNCRVATTHTKCTSLPRAGSRSTRRSFSR